MHIHFYQNSSFPFGMAAAKRRLCYAKGLMQAGNSVSVTIIQRCVEIDKDDGLPESGIYNGIPYCYCAGKYKRSKRNKLMRGLDWCVLGAIYGFFHVLRHVHRGDGMLVYLYPLWSQLLLVLAGKIKGAKIIKETCEHPATLRNPKSLTYKLENWIEYHCIMPLYDGFIAISKSLYQFVEQYKSKKAKCIIVPILVDNDYDKVDYSGVKPPYDVPYIIHTGTMLEQKDSISKILKAFARYRHANPMPCKLVFTGPHANAKCSYLPLIKELGIEDDVELLGMVSTEDVNMYQHFASMTIIYKSDNLQTRNCFPTKLGEMLLSGVPVITTTIGEIPAYLTDKENAYLFNPGDDDKLFDYICIILDNPQAAKNVAEKGKKIALTYFNPIVQGKELSKFFKK